MPIPNPNAHAEEANGQAEQLVASTLPVCGTSSAAERALFETLGFTFAVDRTAAQCSGDLFVAVQFPAGWRKAPTDHTMYTDLLDAENRVRASIFYKASAHDRSASITIRNRFSVQVQNDQVCRIVDACGIVHQSEEISASRTMTEINQDLRRWLDRYYPDWRNPLAYWEMPFGRRHSDPSPSSPSRGDLLTELICSPRGTPVILRSRVSDDSDWYVCLNGVTGPCSRKPVPVDESVEHARITVHMPCSGGEVTFNLQHIDAVTRDNDGRLTVHLR